MSNTENLNNKEAIDKLKSLVNDIMVCLFCSELKTNDGSTCRPMNAIKVCDQGNIWFFSEKDSEKTKPLQKIKRYNSFFRIRERVAI